MNRLTRCIAIGALAVSFATAATADSGKPLFDRLGGLNALNAVVNELWTVVAADSRINAHFAHTKPEAFGSQLVDFLCQASGGPCTYRGKDMRVAHTGMKLSAADFNALAEDTAKVLDKFSVPAIEKKEVLNLLGSLQGDVVGH